MAAALYDNAYDNTPGFEEVQYELAVPENPQHQVLYDDKTVPEPPRRNSVVNYSSLNKESEYIETVVDDPHEFVFERGATKSFPANEYHYIDPATAAPTQSLNDNILGPEPSHENTMARVDKSDKKSAVKIGLLILALVFAIGAFAIVQVSKGSPTPTNQTRTSVGASKLDEVSYALPSGALMYFVLSDCPEGWLPADGGLWKSPPPNVSQALVEDSKTYTPNLMSERRFVRTASSSDDVGTIEEDATSAQGIEFHSSVKVATFGSTKNRITYLQDQETKGLMFDEESDLKGNITSPYSETRPKSIALLACIKK